VKKEHLAGWVVFPLWVTVWLWKKPSRKEFVMAIFVEPAAFDVKEPQRRHQAREREGVDRELRDGLIGAGGGLVVREYGSRRCEPEGNRYAL
jgi:hypothetical protein